MRFLKPCPKCGASNSKNEKMNVKLHQIFPQKGNKNGFGVYIRCEKCGYKTSTFYQKKGEKLSELKDRAVRMWNEVKSYENSEKISIDTQ